MAGPLKVFVLCGQSNMQGHARVTTLDHLGMKADTALMLEAIRDSDGNPRIYSDIPIAYLSSGGEKTGFLTTGFGADDTKIGPELTFGILMHKVLNEPILIIKTAWGGKSLNTDFRSPSAGPYVFNEKQIGDMQRRNQDIEAAKKERTEATGHYYRLTIDYVQKILSDIPSVYPDYDASEGYELSGFVWFQGWNDMVDSGTYPNRGEKEKGGYDDYSVTMAHFIRDIRRDLKAPELPFVIGVLGVNGSISQYPPSQMRYAGIHQNFRDAMAAPASLPEFKGNVAAVLTEKFWDHQLDDLKERNKSINDQVKKQQSDNSLTREQADDLREQLRQQEFTPKELAILDTGMSNLEFHYHGSSRILGRIGQGFAQALIDLMEK